MEVEMYDDQVTLQQDEKLQDKLWQLVKKVRKHKPLSTERQVALTELMAEIYQSGKLGHPQRRSWNSDVYEELYAEAWLKTCEYICGETIHEDDNGIQIVVYSSYNIDKYDPDKGKLMQWVNRIFRCDFIDVVRKYLKLQKITLKYDSLPKDESPTQEDESALQENKSQTEYESDLSENESYTQEKEIFTEAQQNSIYDDPDNFENASSHILSLDQLELQIASEDTSSSELDLDREYIQKFLDDHFKDIRPIKGNPGATFAEILLSRENGATLNEITEEFGIKSISTVADYLKRHLPKLRKKLVNYQGDIRNYI